MLYKIIIIQIILYLKNNIYIYFILILFNITKLLI